MEDRVKVSIVVASHATGNAMRDVMRGKYEDVIRDWIPMNNRILDQLVVVDGKSALLFVVSKLLLLAS